MNRQQRWLEKGYTQEQINNHLSFERHKSKLAREEKKKNNLKNKDLITQIKKDLLKQTFDVGRLKAKILSISPSSDGVGFYFQAHKTFSDGSNGVFREFSHFENYNKEEFIKMLNY